MVPDKNKEVEEEIMDDESCRLIMKERADLAGITSAYFEHSSIHGLRYVFKSFLFLVSYRSYLLTIINIFVRVLSFLKTNFTRMILNCP